MQSYVLSFVGQDIVKSLNSTGIGGVITGLPKAQSVHIVVVVDVVEVDVVVVDVVEVDVVVVIGVTVYIIVLSYGQQFEAVPVIDLHFAV